MAWVVLLIAIVLLGPASRAGAQVVLKAVYGWGDSVRLGRWTPVFVTVSDQQAREAVLEIQGTYGVGAKMLVHQQIVMQPRPITYGLLYPINADASHSVVTLRDAGTGKTIATQLLQDPLSFTGAGRTPHRLLGAQDTLIGIGGNVADALLLQTQFDRVDLPSGILSSLKLPANAIGYEGISVLVLDNADLRDLDPAQQRAIADWTNAGGNLVMIPGSDPLPQKSAVLDLLPCEIGENQALAAPSGVNGRMLTGRAGAEAIQLLDSADWTAYAADRGLGRVIVLPANVSGMAFADDSKAVAFWGSVLSGMAEVRGKPGVTSVVVSEEDQQETLMAGQRRAESVGRGNRETLAIREWVRQWGPDFLANESSRGGILWLAGLCALIGPVDWIILRRCGVVKRNWIAVAGWIGLIACAAGYATSAIQDTPIAGSSYQRRLWDQAGGRCVAATDLLACRSLHRDADINAADRAEFWEPANQAGEIFSAARFADVDFHEDQQGCYPETSSSPANQTRFFRGEKIGAAPPLLAATLRVVHDASGGSRVLGSIDGVNTNLWDLQIETRWGNCRVEPGRIEAELKDQPIEMEGLTKDFFQIAPDGADRVAAMVNSGKYAAVFGRVGQRDDAGSGVVRGVFGIGE